MKGHKTLLIIDADSILIAAAFASQSVFQWDDETVSFKCDLKKAKEIVEAQLDKYRDAVGDKDAGIVMCYSCPTRRYFRHDVYGPYKATRSSSIPPVGLTALREAAQSRYLSRHQTNLEADDVCGILATQKVATIPSFAGADRVVVSVDKDLQQIPGLHLNATNPTEVYKVSPERAEYFLWEQVLTGDTVDNYPGLKGVGPVKAKAILSQDQPYVVSVMDAYEKAGMSPEYLASQVNCARILTNKFFNFRERKPVLWQTPTRS